MIDVKLLMPQEVDGYFGAVADRIQEACDKAHSNMTPAEIYKACRAGGWYLAVVTDETQIIGVLVLDIIGHPLGTTLNVVILAGDNANEWLPDLFANWEWLDSMGVKRIEGTGRPGMARLFGRGLRVLRETYEWVRPNAR